MRLRRNLKSQFFAFVMALTCFIGPPANGADGDTRPDDGSRVEWGYMDRHGRFSLNPPPHAHGPYSEGLAWRLVAADRPLSTYAAVDRFGRSRWQIKSSVVPGKFQCGLSFVNDGSRFGYINKKGHMAIPYQFELAECFSKGRACVGFRHHERWTDCVIDTSGNIISETRYNPDPEFWPYGKTRYDETGHEVYIRTCVSVNHIPLSKFSEGLAWVEISSESGKKNIAYIDTTNRIAFVLGDKVKVGGDFHDGLAGVLVERNGLAEFGCQYKYQLGFINRKGKMVILACPAKSPEKFYSGDGRSYKGDPLRDVYFSDGVARITLDGYHGCFIDRSGKLIGKYCYGRDFQAGLAQVAAVVQATGKVVEAGDTAYGYQSSVIYDKALHDRLREKLAGLISCNAIQIQFSPQANDNLNVSIEMSSGDQDYDRKVLEAAQSVVPPRRGVLLQSYELAWQWQNGELTPCNSRRRKTSPTLPEGADVPDSE